MIFGMDRKEQHQFIGISEGALQDLQEISGTEFAKKKKKSKTNLALKLTFLN
jgi:hypothetical protein